MRRDLRLDAIRGFLLAEITFVHTHAPLSSTVNEFFGRVSMAAAFVFLSGLVAGYVYGKFADNSMRNCFEVSTRRAFYIHKYHVLTFFLLCLVALAIPQYADVFKFFWMDDPSAAWRRIVSFTFLGYQPEFFKVLPLYTIFVLAMPLAFLGFRKGHAVTVLAVSVGLWVFAQFDIVNGRSFGGTVFNPLAWQLVYFAGLYLGYYQLHKQQKIVRPQKNLIAICMLVVALGFTLRWNLIAWPEYAQKGTLLSNKLNHSILYVINFAAFSYLVYCLARRFPKFPQHVFIRPLVLIGQHSIQVFSFHILVVYLTIPLMTSARQVSPWLGLSVGLLIVASLIIPAAVNQRFKENRRSIQLKRVRVTPGS